MKGFWISNMFVTLGLRCMCMCNVCMYVRITYPLCEQEASPVV